jgi:hypothetical protein
MAAMAFVFDSGTHAAIDHERSITIRLSPAFLDAGNLVEFEFINADMTFTFRAMLILQRGDFQWKGKTLGGLQHIATYVLEPTVIQGLANATRKLGAPWPDEQKYELVKAQIAEGLFVLGTQGGQRLQIVPDFRVGFIQRLDDLSQIAPTA